MKPVHLHVDIRQVKKENLFAAYLISINYNFYFSADCAKIFLIIFFCLKLQGFVMIKKGFLRI